MNKLYWIVCEESERTLYEGRFLGRTRGAAMKHLKDQLGRSSLTGLVFSITEIPVPLIREIVAEVLAGNNATVPLSETRPPAPVQNDPENVVRRVEDRRKSRKRWTCRSIPYANASPATVGHGKGGVNDPHWALQRDSLLGGLDRRRPNCSSPLPQGSGEDRG